jgi:5-methylcytosine-specific restriction endonuclease McrA
MLSQQVLLLNASYEPLQLVSARRAIVLLLQARAELVEATSQQVRSMDGLFDLPLVIRLGRYIKLPQRRLACSRGAVFARDAETCQYCGVRPGRLHLTLDHVLPRAQGGPTCWDNVVTACQVCNRKKGGRTPQQANMTLLSQPREPRSRTLLLLSKLEQHDVWRKYAYC